MTRLPIQWPFTDAATRTQPEDSAWSEAEREMLLRGVAAGLTFNECAQQITIELNNRTGVACKREFDLIRKKIGAA